MKILCVLLLFFVSSFAGASSHNALLKAYSDKFLRYDDPKNIRVHYMVGHSGAKTYHFTNPRWRVASVSLTQSDRRNGILRKFHAKMVCDSSFRHKKYGASSWGPWRDGGQYFLSSVMSGYIITDSKGSTFKPSSSSLLKYYTRPKGRGYIVPLKKKK